MNTDATGLRNTAGGTNSHLVERGRSTYALKLSQLAAKTRMGIRFAIFILLATMLGSCTSGTSLSTTTQFLLASIEDSSHLRLDGANGPSSIVIGFAEDDYIDASYIQGQTGQWVCNGTPLTGTNIGAEGTPELAQGSSLQISRDGQFILSLPIHDPPIIRNIHPGDTILTADSIIMFVDLDSISLDQIELRQWFLYEYYVDSSARGMFVGGYPLDTTHASRRYHLRRSAFGAGSLPPGRGFIAVSSNSIERYPASLCSVPNNTIHYFSTTIVPVVWK